MNRIEKVREVVDSIILSMMEDDERRYAYVHLYGVAQAAALIAEKRKENVELSIIAAMLHDLYNYLNEDAIDDHAHKGALMAKKILNDLKIFSCEEIDLVYSAIYHHSDKKIINKPFEEVLKDADVMQTAFYNPLYYTNAYKPERLDNLKKEFGMI